MMQSIASANKDALFAKYINREPGTVIPAQAGIQSFAIEKKPLDARPLPSQGHAFRA